MCGITGIYNLDAQPVNLQLLKKMNRTLAHRGPDDEGYFVNAKSMEHGAKGKESGAWSGEQGAWRFCNGKGNVGLGHRRLSIIDLSTGKQPLCNEDGSVWVAFNGEIYNFQSLKKVLIEKGHEFTTNTDTEVIVHSYEEWGIDCVRKFRGMFAFALWDATNDTLFIARDRLGIKPLYYRYEASKRLCFASELKALLEDDSINKNLNYEAVSDFFSFGYIPAPKSIFKDIFKLPAGHILIYKNNTLSIQKYWDIRFSAQTQKTESQYCENLICILEEAVKLRLISDVPLGAFLSGGIDSSIVVALMSRLLKDPVITNSIGFSIQKYNELSYARRTSDFFGTNHNEFTVTPDIMQVIDKLAWHYDEPFADSSSIPTYYVSKMTRQNVTVALSGDGGDENFAGYRRYYFDFLENRLRNIFPAAFRKNIIGPIASIYPKADWLPQVFRAKTLLTNLSMNPVQGYFNSMSMFLPGMKELLFSEEFKQEMHGYDSLSVFQEHYNACDSKDPLSRIQYIDFKTYLAEDILTKVDRASMAEALEVRVPILDHKFVEYAAGIPSGLKLKAKDSKYIFKKAVQPVLSDDIIHREKMGFSIPIGEWIKNELNPLAGNLLQNELSENGIFNKQYVKNIFGAHCRGFRDFTQPLWTLLSFCLWKGKFLSEDF